MGNLTPDNLRLTKDNLIFRFTSISPNTMCSETIASLNIEVATPKEIVTVQELLMNALPIYGLSINFRISNAVGCNWDCVNCMTTHKSSDILLKSLQNIDQFINYDCRS